MSVMTLGLEVYQEVYKKACSYYYRAWGSVDINYCHALQCNEKYLRDWVSWLYEMVHVSYCVHYHHAPDEEQLQMIREAIDEWRYNGLKGNDCNTYQMLKHLQCIRYQIEDYEMKPDGKWKDEYDEPLELLNNAINELKCRIISIIPEYKEAKWGCV